MGKLNTNSNGYIFGYAAVMVLIVAFLLASVYQALKERSDKNVENDKKSQILASLNIRDLDDEEVVKKYEEVVISDQIINSSAEVVSEKGGFDVKKIENNTLPLYICKIDGKTKYVLPMKGKGLWGPIWGYVSINDDKKNVYGAYFNHEGETAGLGAIISEYEGFQKQFEGHLLKKGNSYLSVVKFGTVKDAEIQCDGISGATKTCDGVSAMIASGLEQYGAFLNK